MTDTTSRRARWLIGMGFADPKTGELTPRGEEYAEEKRSGQDPYDKGPHGWDPGDPGPDRP